MLLGHSFEARTNSRAPGTTGSVMSFGLTITDAVTRKSSLTRETRLTSPEHRAAGRRQSADRACFSPSQSRKRQKKAPLVL